MTSSRSDLRNAVACALAMIAAWLLTWPFVNSPFNDDWSYAFTVKQLLATGHLVYNGWASASLIAQAYWGALWVILLRSTSLNLFDALRLSTLPLAAGAVALCYLLARRCGLRPSLAVFIALLLGFSPLYLPMAVSFMTDAPGVFFMFLSLYALVRAAESPGRRAAILWLALGILVGLIGGTGRQIVWIVPLAVLPYIGWLRRSDRKFALAAAGGWVVIFAGALATLKWFARQPYAIPESSLFSDLRHAAMKPAHFAMTFITIGLTTILVILPAALMALRRWRGRRAAVAAAIFIAFGLVLIVRPSYALMPWMDNTITITGVMASNELAGKRPVALPISIRAVLSFAVFAVAAILLADILLWLTKPRRAWDQTHRFFLRPPPGRVMLPAMTLFAVAYLVLLLPRCTRDMAFDRYVLPLMPCLAIPLLLREQFTVKNRLSMFAWILLGVFGFYGIATTQELQSLARARETATLRLQTAGIPRTWIDAGFEYDRWTELESTGYINDPRIHNPPHAYKKGLETTPSVQARYRIEVRPVRDTAATAFGIVSYLSYLPPFHRQVSIDRFTDPWWLDPARATTRPADRRHQLLPTAALEP
jgi:hypothetical protein